LYLKVIPNQLFVSNVVPLVTQKKEATRHLGVMIDIPAGEKRTYITKIGIIIVERETGFINSSLMEIGYSK